ncbi:NADH-dependent flavin oxidoreductase [Ferroacidibacillus organovorans]|uniref:NADH-dependent flavin oxidoreductase n=1 Tax=Ferroacidibacillus organovorans TaxID=1765683 RepID=A0A101XRN1_9BACL|nr:NADH-dependent flavin oxidoreductase [Ferroacidibacillus organovorans]KUO96277.1 NADH-dependent flavin oxidoreductase [Ferroacidibacillus organovorans]
MNSTYQPLFQSIRLRRGVVLKNRIVMAPMTHFSSLPDGSVSDEEIRYYKRRSGGVGMVITACVFVSPSGKGFPGEFGAEREDRIEGLARLARGIKEQGAKAVLQIFHGGRACAPDLVPGGDVVSASDVSEDKEGAPIPRPLTEAEIMQIVRDFGEATRRAIAAGFDGVELHGANGYLIQQFYSPHTNKRSDRFGGSRENRLTFPLMIVDEVTRVVKEHAKNEFLIGYRFSPEEAYEHGLKMEDTYALIDALKYKALDYLHVSATDYRTPPKSGEDQSASRIALIVKRAGADLPVIGVGSIKTPDDALDALSSTGCTLIALGREIIIEPDWVQKVARGDEHAIATELSLSDQERLVVPTPLWNAITRTPGWFPLAAPANA